jgi:hypothetical protein
MTLRWTVAPRGNFPPETSCSAAEHEGSVKGQREEEPVQLSNVPELRPARRLLVIASVMYTVLLVFNVAATVVSFAHDDSDRWLNLVRLVPNLVVPLLIWRGYVLLAALAERAALYKQVLEKDLPKLREAVQERDRASVED